MQHNSPQKLTEFDILHVQRIPYTTIRYHTTITDVYFCMYTLCVCVVCDMSLLFLCVYTKVDRVHHEEVVQAKEEELAKAVEERDELKCTLKSAENKLEELKGKNNVSHSCYM